MAAVTYSNEDLNRFWLQVMGDNALIMLNALSPQEAMDAPKAEELAKRFDALALRADQKPTPEQTAQINMEAHQAAQDFRKFLLRILNILLTSKYHIDLKPTIIYHFAAEAERYIGMVNIFMQNKKPVYDALQEEIFWLPLFSIQNRYIADSLGYFQVQNRNSARNLAFYFSNYAAYSVELKGLSRIGTEDFPLAQEHHIAVADLLNTYFKFLNNLISLQQRKRIPGSMSLLYLDRSRRILCRFIKQMAVYLDSEVPECDHFAKRISSN